MIGSSKNISRLIFLIALTLTFEMLGLPQPITGPIVNMMLLLATLIISPLAGCILGLITPLVAGLRGQLPPLLLPMIPFIISANVALVLVFFGTRRFLAQWLAEKNVLLSIPAWSALVLAALIKFVILYHAARFILPMYLGKELPEAIVAAMSLPQFLTAILGGALAFLIFRMLQSRSLV